MEESFTPQKLFILIVELVLLFLMAVVSVGLIRQYVISSMNVSGPSMAPTLKESGDKVYVYRQGKIERGDVIIFYRPPHGEVNDESLNPASRKVSFSDFMRSLPIIGEGINVTEDGDGYVAIVKRVVACPGDTVKFVNGELYVENVKEERFVFKWASPGVGDHYVHTMQEDEYFVLGDNRGNSTDSEDYGPIKKSQIYGKVVMIKSGSKYKTNF